MLESLVLTLELDEATTARFHAERLELFPPGRTKIGAHLTLFHAVPGELLDEVLAEVRDATSRPAFDVAVTKVMSLGRGAAYSLESAEMTGIHRRLQKAWAHHLTRQDSQGFRAHVTVQNKVDPALAKETVARLQAAFAPFTARAEGIAVWRYVGGPWEPVERFAFGSPQPQAE